MMRPREASAQGTRPPQQRNILFRPLLSAADSQLRKPVAKGLSVAVFFPP